LRHRSELGTKSAASKAYFSSSRIASGAWARSSPRSSSRLCSSWSCAGAEPASDHRGTHTIRGQPSHDCWSFPQHAVQVLDRRLEHVVAPSMTPFEVRSDLMWGWIPTTGVSLFRRSRPPASIRSRAAGHLYTRQLGEPVEQSVLERDVTRFARRRRVSPMMPVVAADTRSGVFAHRQPSLRRVPGREVVGRSAATHLRGTQPGSTALLSTPGQRRATANASAVTYNLLSEYAWSASHARVVHAMSRNDASAPRCIELLR
jgi:hypothetical protein